MYRTESSELLESDATETANKELLQKLQKTEVAIECIESCIDNLTRRITSLENKKEYAASMYFEAATDDFISAKLFENGHSPYQMGRVSTYLTRAAEYSEKKEYYSGLLKIEKDVELCDLLKEIVSTYEKVINNLKTTYANPKKVESLHRLFYENEKYKGLELMAKVLEKMFEALCGSKEAAKRSSYINKETFIDLCRTYKQYTIGFYHSISF